MLQPFNGIVNETLKAFGGLQVVEAVEAHGGSCLRSDDGGAVMSGTGRIRVSGAEKMFMTESPGIPADEGPHGLVGLGWVGGSRDTASGGGWSSLGLCNCQLQESLWALEKACVPPGGTAEVYRSGFLFLI